MLMMEARRC